MISEKPLRDFGNRHPPAAKRLSTWAKAVKGGTFNNLVDLKRTFGSVDYARVNSKEAYVFNVGGNNYRVIAAVHCKGQRLYVRAV